MYINGQKGKLKIGDKMVTIYEAVSSILCKGTGYICYRRFPILFLQGRQLLWLPIAFLPLSLFS